jgi:hypothetical protein
MEIDFLSWVQDMDRTGRVDGVYRRLNIAKQTELIRAEPPPQKFIDHASPEGASGSALAIKRSSPTTPGRSLSTRR